MNKVEGKGWKERIFGKKEGIQLASCKVEDCNYFAPLGERYCVQCYQFYAPTERKYK